MDGSHQRGYVTAVLCRSDLQGHTILKSRTGKHAEPGMLKQMANMSSACMQLKSLKTPCSLASHLGGLQLWGEIKKMVIQQHKNRLSSQTGSEERHVCDPAEQQKHSKADMNWLLIKHQFFWQQNWKKCQLFEHTAVAYQWTQRTLLRRFSYSVTQHRPPWGKRWGWGYFFLPYKPSENTDKYKDVRFTWAE